MSILLASQRTWLADSSVCSLFCVIISCVAGENRVEELTIVTAVVLVNWTEGVCSRIGKVRRIKFYRDERGGLKGDAVVTFNSRATMIKAVDRVKLLVLVPVGA